MLFAGCGLASPASAALYHSGPASHIITCREVPMDPHKARAAAALAALTADLYQSSRVYTRPGAPDPVVIMVGPELQNHPWLEGYLDRAIVREFRAAMQGREEWYIQAHDLLNLLQLQFAPITPALQYAVSQMLWQEYGLWIPATSIVQMTGHEIQDATGRLTAFLATEGLEADMVQYARRDIPLVIHTAYMEHALCVAGKTVHIRPTRLTIEGFVMWFRESACCVQSATDWRSIHRLPCGWPLMEPPAALSS
jgi:hypothetical protein